MWQLIYTSAPRGLVSGQSGFCTVARSADLREAVAQRIEQLSSYRYLEVAAVGQPNRNPTIAAYRIVDIRGTKYHLLTRIRPSGLDFTARTNHIAQHLVFVPDELARLPSPAAILRHWEGWLPAWQGEPRLLEPIEIQSFQKIPGPVWPATAWQRTTGDGGRAAGLLEGECARGCYLLCPGGGEDLLLELFCETLQLPNFTGKYPARPWQYTFTTFLQGEDVPADFLWRGCQQGTPGYQLAVRRSASPIAIQAIRVPNNPLARMAREGPKGPAPPGPGRGHTSLTLKRDPAYAPAAPTGETDFSRRQYKTASRRAPPPRTWSLTLGPAFFRAIAIAAVLGLLGAGIIYRWQIRQRSAVGTTASSGTSTNDFSTRGTSNTPQIAQPAKHVEPQTNKLASPVEAPNEASLKKLEHDFPDIETFVTVVTSLESEPIVLGARQPLETAINRLENVEILSKDINLIFCRNNWVMPVRLPLSVNYSEKKLIGRSSEAQFVFDSVGQGGGANGKIFRVQADSAIPMRSSFSVLFQPANQTKPFEPFRLLIVSEIEPPHFLELEKGFLDPAQKELPQLLRDPLRSRWGRIHLAETVKWQVRPLIRLPNGSEKDLYAQWPKDQQPSPGAELDFKSFKQPLLESLKRLEDKTGQFEQRLHDAQADLKGDTDFDLAIGPIFKVETNTLASFKAYTKQRRGPAAPSDLYLDYLQELAKQGRSQLNWLTNWSVPQNQNDEVTTDSLNKLQELCSNNIKDKSEKKKLRNNYFLTVWQQLKLQEKIDKLEQDKRTLESQTAQIKSRIEQVPETLAQVSTLSLCIVSPNNKPLEMIRFVGP